MLEVHFLAHQRSHLAKEVHEEVVKRFDVLLNRLYIEPPQGLGYPIEDLPMLRKLRITYKTVI